MTPATPHEPMARPARIDPACPTSEFPIRVGGKWTGMAVVCLTDGPRRFGELRAQLGDVTAKVLTQTLRDMCRDGLVIRRDHQENPPRVTYELTDLGRSLIEVIDTARAWSETHMDAMLDARTSFDSA